MVLMTPLTSSKIFLYSFFYHKIMLTWNSTHTALVVAGAITITAINTHLPLSEVAFVIGPILAYAGIREYKRTK